VRANAGHSELEQQYRCDVTVAISVEPYERNFHFANMIRRVLGYFFFVEFYPNNAATYQFLLNVLLTSSV